MIVKIPNILQFGFALNFGLCRVPAFQEFVILLFSYLKKKVTVVRTAERGTFDAQETEGINAGLGVKGDRAGVDWPSETGANLLRMTPVPLHK